MKLWCIQQIADNENQVICTTHLAEARAFPCPYTSNEERQKAKYPCSDYEELWCEHQVVDDDDQIVCIAHLAEARALLCPYANKEERQSAEYPCSDYKERGV